MKALTKARLLTTALATLALIILLLAACGEKELVDTGPNAHLSNEDLFKKAVSNMKSLKSYHFEFRGDGLPSDGGIKISPSLSIVGDIQSNGKGSKIKLTDEAATPTSLSSGPNPDSVILDVGGGVDMLIVEGQQPYHSYDEGKTWVQWGVDTPASWLLAIFGFRWEPQEDMNGLSYGELMLQDATFKDGKPRIEQVDGVTTRHIVAEMLGTNMYAGYANEVVDLWVSTDITPTIRQMRIASMSFSSENPPALPADVHSLSFSPEGRWLAVGDVDGVIRLWDLRAPNSPPKKLHAKSDESDEPTRAHVVFSPDGKTLAESAGSEIRLWDTSDFEAQPAVLPISSTVSSLAFRPDGKMLAVGAEGEFYLWDLPVNHAGPKRIVLPTPQPTDRPTFNDVAVGFSPDGKMLATVKRDNFVRLFDVQNPQMAPTVLSHSDEVLFTEVAFSPDGSLLVAAGSTYNSTLAIWNLREPQAMPLDIEGDVGLRQVTFSPDGQLLASLGDNPVELRKVSRLDMPTPVITDTYPGPRVIAFSPDSSKLAAGFDTGKVRLYDLRQPEAKPVVLIEKREIDQSKGKPYTLTWKWGRFDEDFGEIRPPSTVTTTAP